MRERSFAEKGKSNQDKQLENQNDKHGNNAKGKEIFSDHTEFEGSNMGRDHVAAESYNQEKLDEILGWQHLWWLRRKAVMKMKR